MYTVTAYALSEEKLDFEHYIEVDRVMFEDEQDALDWADDMGFLGTYGYSVSLEDDNGTITYL